MKNFILTMMLLCSLYGTSQECFVPDMQVEQNSSQCQTQGEVQVLVGFTDFRGADQIEVLVYNITEDTDELILVYEPFILFPFGPYPQGTELEILASPSLNGAPCQSTYALVTVLGCDEVDNDGDGYTADVDCNDSDSRINPGATEVCDRKDNNCDGNIDEGVNYTFYVDSDGDTYGDPERPIYSCNSQPTGFLVNNNTDCDDTNPNINPGATEILGNSIDDDCNPDTPDDDPLNTDDDGDGQTENQGDCDDTNPNIYAGNTEVPYNGIDDDCNPATLDDDLDGDGYNLSEDCDDTNSAVNPGATEILGNSIDDDCNPDTPDADPLNTDDDGDGQTENQGDCDDTNPNIYAGNDETPYNGIDDDCNPATLDDDLDGDGYTADVDCDDTNSAVNPGATEILGNNIDDDCNENTPDNNECLIDTDNDGTPDCEDLCPNDRKKTEPGDCGCGNVDRDRDGDGVADCNDVCDREDDTIDVDNDGIPDCIDPCIGDQDSDGDGILDCNDLCNGEDDLLDTDTDGIPDCLDICPNDPANLCNANPCSVGEVLICHMKNNGDILELCVRDAQLQRHLDHGDTLGTCNDTPARQMSLIEDIDIYPNPNSGKFIIGFNKNEFQAEMVTISIKNSFGIEVYKTKLETSRRVELDIKDHLKNQGIYFVIITNAHATTIKRIIISK